MQLFMIALAVLVVGGLASTICGPSRLASRLGAGSAIAGSLLGLAVALIVLATGQTDSLQYAWSMPGGSFSIGMDALSAFFLIPVFGLSALAALYGNEYLHPYLGKKNLGPHWFFYNLLVAGLAIVIVARNGLLFLIAWEVMSLAPFFLVTFDDDKESVRSAGWTYLIAAHLGAVPLLVFFIILGNQAGSMDFSAMGSLAGLSPALAGVLFVLAVLGFGTKAGFIPLHVWLPEAHPAAPSHVSAVMSGVMIKAGIYGLIRVLMFLGPPPPWWGDLFIAVGLVSGLLGILFAAAQHEVKRFLAYSSIENIGIISLAMGLGLIGRSYNIPFLAAAGFAGALLHVLNHSIFKGMLFMGAGSVLHSTGTARIDRLGGLLKKMPVTGAAFLVGAVAICGLPPLNGFVSEFIIYFTGIQAGITMDGGPAVAAWATVTGLALIGGLAVASFTKVFGTVFLGEPRSKYAEHAHEAGWGMRVPMMVLATLCLVIGLSSPLIVSAISGPVSVAAGMPENVVSPEFGQTAGYMGYIVIASVVFIVLSFGVYILRARLLSGRSVGSAGTWDCGYARPTSRMQYTASSFAEPITTMMASVLRINSRVFPPNGLFPRAASFSTDVPGGAREFIYQPLFSWVAANFRRFRWLQHGKIHLYALYIAVTLVVFLLWKL